MKYAFALFLTCALNISGCKAPPLEPVEVPNAKKPPGANGNPVLWIEPEARHPQGASKAEDFNIAKKLINSKMEFYIFIQKM